jgi:hypothetical protein
MGHGVCGLADEKMDNALPNLPGNADAYPNVVAWKDANGINRVPTLDMIPWKHWLPSSHYYETVEMGEPIDTTCGDSPPDDLGLCQCEHPAARIPLPTCIPVDTEYFFRRNCRGHWLWPEPHDIAAQVGLYEGGLYWQRGVYRPMLRCRMRSYQDVAVDHVDNVNHEDLTRQFCWVCREALVRKILMSSTTIWDVDPDNAPNTGVQAFSVTYHRPLESELEVEWKYYAKDAQGEYEEVNSQVVSVVAGIGGDTHTVNVDADVYDKIKVSVTDLNDAVSDPNGLVHPDHPDRDSFMVTEHEWLIR